MQLPFRPDSTPSCGLQIIGNFFDEPRVIMAAHAFERAFAWSNRLPTL